MKNTVYLYEDDIGKIDLIQYMGEDITIVNSARVSFGVQKEELNEKDLKLINYLIKHNHTSTLEHNIATFRIKVPLYIRSQHHRHRTWSYNEISRRYTDVNIEFYVPKDFRTQHKSNRQSSNLDMINPTLNCDFWSGDATASEIYQESCNEALSIYKSLVKSGICREQARGILPQTTYTEYYATANLNNILKFISLRIHDGAQWEIKQLALGMLEIVSSLWPETIKAYKEINNMPL